MPNRDQTGPEGKGPMTGGCRGYCTSGFVRTVPILPLYKRFGRGCGGLGRGLMRGFRGGRNAKEVRE